MRAVFTGPTGSEKQKVAQAVALEAAKNRSLPPDLSDRHTRRYIQVLSVEEEIKNTLGDLRPFLDQVFKRERIRRWQEAMEVVLARADAAEHTILCFHNVFCRRSNFFTCTDWDLLLAYRPTVFVTLINDVYDVWETVNARERELATNSYLDLPEILAWRSAEIAATEALAENLYVKADRHGIDPSQLAALRKASAVSRIFGRAIPHFVFAVKHPVQTLYRLLFRRDLLLTYASFPISKPRSEADPAPCSGADPNPAGQQEIDDYRRRLLGADFLTVFDPLTIDELRLCDTLTPDQWSLRPRWPMTLGPPMASEIELTANPFEGYSSVQYESLKESVVSHVESRDYQLVSQSSAVAAYRPFYGGPRGSGAGPSQSPSGGVEKELGYALAESKLIYAVHPPEDKIRGPQVFQNINFAVQPETVEGLLEELRKAQQRWAERLKGHGDAQTWDENPD